MSETSRELELSVRPSSQPEPERQLQPPPLFQLPLPTQDRSETHRQTQLELQQSELQHQSKPVWINHRRLLLLLLAFGSCVAILGLIYYMHHSLQNRSQPSNVSPCVSPACQQASVRLSMYADLFMQPCDYFMFRCGSDRRSPDSGGRQRGQGLPGHPQNQEEKVVWPQGKDKEREDRGLREETILDRKTVLVEYLREILESNGTSGSAAEQKARGFYNSCLDTESIEAAGAEPFLTLVQKLGGWAVSGHWNRTDFNSTLSLLMRDYATFPFFSLQVGRDPNEIASGTTKRYIQIDQPDLLIPIEWNSKTQKSQANTQTLRPFLASCESYLALLGSPPGSSMIHVGTFISLSSELAVAAAPLHYRLSKGQLYQRMTIKELQRQAPAIDWLRCLQAAFHPLTLTEDDHVLLQNLPYVVQMSHIIGKWLNMHEPRTSDPLHTYMVFHLLHTLMPALDSRFSETAKNLSVALGNSEGQVAPRWKHCVFETVRGFDSVLRKRFSERTVHPAAEEVIQNILSSFNSRLHNLRWTDQKTHQLVMKKVQSLIPRLWTTGDTANDTDLDLLFSKVTVGTCSFFSSYVQLLSLSQKRRSKLLTEQTEAADILSVTPVLLGNDFLFPMGMFIPPLFHPTYPRAMNYGAIGFLIAKDVLHLILTDETPVRLFKHQIQSEAVRAPNRNTATPTSLHVSQLILGVVSQCKHRGGISMVELKETLAAGGYDVTKNNRHMNVVTQRLVNTETLVRTTRNATLRLNKKHTTDTKEIKMTSVKSKPQPKEDLQPRKTTRKSIKAAEKPQTQARKSSKPKGKSNKLTGKTRTTTRKTRKAKRKSPKQMGNKHRSAIKRGAWVRKAPRKTQRTPRHRPKQTRRTYKSSWKRQTQKRRLPKTRPRLKTRRRRAAWRRVFYYYY